MVLLLAGSKSWVRLNATDSESSAGDRCRKISSARAVGSMRWPTRMNNGSLNIVRKRLSAELMVGWPRNSFFATLVTLRSSIKRFEHHHQVDVGLA
jgi:hypothetical protein